MTDIKGQGLTHEDVKMLMEASMAEHNSKGFVTHGDLQLNIKTIKADIELAKSHIQKWILIGVGSLCLTFGGSAIAVIIKIDRASEASVQALRLLDGRIDFMARTDDRLRNLEVHADRVDNEFERPPYQPLPR